MKAHLQIVLLPLIFVSVQMLHAQQPKADSLKAAFGIAMNDSLRCNILLETGDLYHRTSLPDSALHYYNQCQQLAKQRKLYRHEAIALRKKGIVQRRQGKNHEALDLYTQSLKVATEIQDKDLMAAAYNNMGVVHRTQGNFDLATENYLKSLEINIELNNTADIANSYNNLGIVYHSMGHYEKAQLYWLEALKVYEEIGDDQGLGNTFNNIALVNFQQEIFDKALEYHLLALEVRLRIGEQRAISASYANLGSVYYYLEDYDKANDYQQKALNIFEELGDKNGISAALNNIGSIYRQLHQFEKAIDFFQRSLQVRQELGDRQGLSVVYNSMANLYLDLAQDANPAQRETQLNAAKEYGEMAFSIAKDIGAIPTQNNAANTLRKVYTALNKYREALNYANIYIITRDSLFSEEKSKALSEMQTRYESEKKQQEINAQQLIIERQQLEYSRRQSQQNFMLIVSALILLIALGVSCGYFLIRRKNKRLNEVNDMLAYSEENLKLLIRSKDKLYSIIAHDIKSPLTGLAGLSEFLSEDVSTLTPSEITQFGKLIHDSSKKLFYLTENLLYWARSQTGNIRMEPRKIILRELCDEVVCILKIQAKTKNICLINEIPHHININADPNTLSTVFRNLISNAIKFTRENGHVHLSAQSLTDKTEVLIADTGVGISPENIEKLFQLENSFSTRGTSNESGTGLGLLVCKEFIEGNGGQISVQSTPNKGTTFCISFPS